MWLKVRTSNDKVGLGRHTEHVERAETELDKGTADEDRARCVKETEGGRKEAYRDRIRAPAFPI